MAVGMELINGDWNINGEGKVSLVMGRDKCARDFNKMLKTEIVNFTLDPTNTRYNPYYGTQLYDPNLLTGMPPSTQIDILNTAMASAIKYYIQLQENRTNLSIDEVITNIDSMIYQDPSNKERLIIKMTVYTGSSNSFSILSSV